MSFLQKHVTNPLHSAEYLITRFYRTLVDPSPTSDKLYSFSRIRDGEVLGTSYFFSKTGHLKWDDRFSIRLQDFSHYIPKPYFYVNKDGHCLVIRKSSEPRSWKFGLDPNSFVRSVDGTELNTNTRIRLYLESKIQENRERSLPDEIGLTELVGENNFISLGKSFVLREEDMSVKYIELLDREPVAYYDKSSDQFTMKRDQLYLKELFEKCLRNEGIASNVG